MSSEPVEYFVSYYKSGKLYSRRSIGELSDEGIELIKEKVDFDKIPDFNLHKARDLDISSPKEKPTHIKALERFTSEVVFLIRRSKEYSGQLDAYIQKIKSNADFQHIDWDGCFGKCNNRLLSRYFPVPLNLALGHDQYVLRHHTFLCLPTPFQRFFRRFRNIAVILELESHADTIRELLSWVKVLQPKDQDDISGSKPIAPQKSPSTTQKKSQKRGETGFQPIYEKEVKRYLDNLEQNRAKDLLTSKELKKQRGIKYIATVLQKLDYFKNKAKPTELSSIGKGIKNSSIWTERKEKYPHIYGRATTQSRNETPSVQKKNRMQEGKMKKVRRLDPRYEEAVENLLDWIIVQKSLNKDDRNHIIHEFADNLTTEKVAKYLKETVEEFKNVDTDVIINGLEYCDAWINLEQKLDSAELL